jgi:hypothetical protein
VAKPVYLLAMAVMNQSRLWQLMVKLGADSGAGQKYDVCLQVIDTPLMKRIKDNFRYSQGNYCSRHSV